MFRGQLIALLFALALALGARGAEAPLSRYDRVEIAPTKTSIYVGSVSMTMPAFTRKSGVYESTYSAKVFPYFFYNEKGKLWIDTSDDDVRRLERGETVNFTGHAVSDDGAERRIEGRAVPADAGGGKIKVRIFVSKRIDLVFNTTYAFPKK